MLQSLILFLLLYILFLWSCQLLVLATVNHKILIAWILSFLLHLLFLIVLFVGPAFAVKFMPHMPINFLVLSIAIEHFPTQAAALVSYFFANCTFLLTWGCLTV